MGRFVGVGDGGVRIDADGMRGGGSGGGIRAGADRIGGGVDIGVDDADGNVVG